MKLIKLKPITSGMRHQLNIKKNLLSKTNKLLKNSIVGFKKFAGRSALNGKISVWHQGGGCKSNYRKINFTSQPFESIVICIMYDPKRSSFISLNFDLRKKYFFQTLSTNLIYPGSLVACTEHQKDLSLGNRTKLKNIPTGSLVHSLTNSFNLEKVCFVKKYSIEKEERGVIPMVNCTPLDKNILAIGSNGGCLRASSGYAFNSIQRQTKKLANDLLRGKNITKQRQILQPHSNIEKILDQVFLRVLMENPRRAPGLFIKIGLSMTGDEFALFMSGKAKLSIIVKMIISLPKRLFIKAMFTEIRSAFGYDKLSRNN